nr:retrovirus-related Pol polyprotein from transposon TNT 1-94 [Tanacetum cinerariifolium]
MKKLMNKSWKHIKATWQRYRRFLLQIQAPILSQWNSNVIPDSPNMCEDDIQNDQNDVKSDDERKEIAKPITPLFKTASEEDSDPKQAQRDKDMQKNLALIAKYFQKIYKPTKNNLRISSNSKNKNVDMTQRYKNDDHSGQFGTQRTMNVAGIREKNTAVFKLDYFKGMSYNDICLIFKAKSNANMEFLLKSKEHIEEEANRAIESINETLAQKAAKRRRRNEEVKDVEEIKQDLEISDSLKFVHELKQEMHADLKYVESLEKEIDELASDKAEFLDMYDVILQECVSKDIMCSYLMSLSDLDALDELQYLYLHKVKECDCLAKNFRNKTESVSKKDHTELLQRFAKVEKHLISLELALQKCKEQGKGKSVDTKFDRPSVVRQPNAQRIPEPSVLGKLTPFLNSLDRIYFQKTASVPKANVSEGLSKLVTTQTLPQTAKKAGLLCQRPQSQSLPRIFIVDSGCTKHMTGNLKLLCNFVEKFLGIVCFGNDQFMPILGYRDLVQGNVTINRVYYVKGLNHNLFSVGQFCDADLEVAFMNSTCFVRDLQGNNLLTGNCESDLYTISFQESTSSTPLCLMAKATLTQAWLWHRRLSHLNFDYINLLSKKDIVIGLPKLKYVKDQLCSSCELSKVKRSLFKSKAILSSKGRLNLLHMD